MLTDFLKPEPWLFAAPPKLPLPFWMPLISDLSEVCDPTISKSLCHTLWATCRITLRSGKGFILTVKVIKGHLILMCLHCIIHSWGFFLQQTKHWKFSPSNQSFFSTKYSKSPFFFHSLFVILSTRCWCHAPDCLCDLHRLHQTVQWTHVHCELRSKDFAAKIYINN